ncbi:host specificity domain protein [Escherichia coli STEC_EH250]|nr:host specificity domain protein [Escherichia coli STEC_EH250]
MEVSASDGQYLALAKWDTPRVVKGVRFSLRLTSGSGENSRLGDQRPHGGHGAPFQWPASGGIHPDGQGDKQLRPAGRTCHHYIPD